MTLQNLFVDLQNPYPLFGKLNMFKKKNPSFIHLFIRPILAALRLASACGIQCHCICKRPSDPVGHKSYIHHLVLIFYLCVTVFKGSKAGTARQSNVANIRGAKKNNNVTMQASSSSINNGDSHHCLSRNHHSVSVSYFLVVVILVSDNDLFLTLGSGTSSARNENLSRGGVKTKSFRFTPKFLCYGPI